MNQTIYSHQMDTIDGRSVSLESYAGKLLLIVNTASKCGFTPQYQGLQALYDEFNGAGLEILGFPCNQFGEQEQGSNNEISEFCQLNYGVSFPMFAKVEVNGPQAHPLFVELKERARGVLGTRKIKWNFTKFLVAPDGRVLGRYGPFDKPEKIRGDIVGLLPGKEHE